MKSGWSWAIYANFLWDWLGDADGAVAAFQRSLEADPNEHASYCGLARVNQYAYQRSEEAEAYYLKARLAGSKPGTLRRDLNRLHGSIAIRRLTKEF